MSLWRRRLCVKTCVSSPSRDELRDALVAALQDRDLTSISLRTLRNELENILRMPEGSLESRKEEIACYAQEYVQQVSVVANSHDAIDDRCGDEDAGREIRRAQRKERRRKRRILRLRSGNRKGISCLTTHPKQKLKSKVKAKKKVEANDKKGTKIRVNVAISNSGYRRFVSERFAPIKEQLRASLNDEVSIKIGAIMKAVSESWRLLAEDEKAQFAEKHRMAQAEAESRNVEEQRVAKECEERQKLYSAEPEVKINDKRGPKMRAKSDGQKMTGGYSRFISERFTFVKEQLRASSNEDVGLGTIMRAISESWRSVADEEKTQFAERHRMALAEAQSREAEEQRLANECEKAQKLTSAQQEGLPPPSKKRRVAADSEVPNDGVPAEALTDIDWPMTRTEFKKLDQNLKLTVATPHEIGGELTTPSSSCISINMAPKTLNSGSIGWSHFGQCYINVGNRRLSVQTRLQFVVVGSKDWPPEDDTEECTAASQLADGVLTSKSPPLSSPLKQDDLMQVEQTQVLRDLDGDIHLPCEPFSECCRMDIVDEGAQVTIDLTDPQTPPVSDVIIEDEHEQADLASESGTSQGPLGPSEVEPPEEASTSTSFFAPSGDSDRVAGSLQSTQSPPVSCSQRSVDKSPTTPTSARAGLKNLFVAAESSVKEIAVSLNDRCTLYSTECAVQEWSSSSGANCVRS